MHQPDRQTRTGMKVAHHRCCSGRRQSTQTGANTGCDRPALDMSLRMGCVQQHVALIADVGSMPPQGSSRCAGRQVFRQNAPLQLVAMAATPGGLACMAAH
jgi:hypothetical protein